MTREHSIAFVLIVLLGSSAGAQETREAAPAEYLDALARRFGEEPKPPVDPSVAMQGMSPTSKPDDLTPGYVLIEGDIRIPLEKWEALVAGEPPDAVFGTVDYWDNNIVPFDIDANVTWQQTNANNAMAAISARTGVIFRARQGGDPDWIRFRDANSNSSPVGRQGGMQIINIASWGSRIIIVHEIYHSLGFWHEQSAPDRNTFVTINYNNICGSSGVPGNACHPATCQQCGSPGNWISCAYKFDIRSGADVWGPYDFDSLMHYSRADFSCNGNDTITVNELWREQWQNRIGQRNHFSLIDELSCRGIYPFPGDRWLRAGTGGITPGTGTFFRPFRAPWYTAYTAYDATPVNGTLLIDPGEYSGLGTYSEAKTIRGTYGLVRIGN